jgi:glycosyltransferase involved in cell wall biosynthesis
LNPLLPVTSSFRDVSIIVAAINETASLRKTVEIIYDTCNPADVAEIIVAVSKKSTPECLQTCRELEVAARVPFSVLVQQRRFAGGAYQDAFDIARGSHVIMMASDLETDPHSIAGLIAAAKAQPGAIICTSRWHTQGNFGAGYNPVKFVLNYVFQKLMRLFFHADLTDWTFGYRLFPTVIVQSIAWAELRHPFFLETILKPLRLGVPVQEISTSWAPREEGESQNPFWRNFLYFKTVYAVLVANSSTFLKANLR